MIYVIMPPAALFSYWCMPYWTCWQWPQCIRNKNSNRDARSNFSALLWLFLHHHNTVKASAICCACKLRLL